MSTEKPKKSIQEVEPDMLSAEELQLSVAAQEALVAKPETITKDSSPEEREVWRAHFLNDRYTRAEVLAFLEDTQRWDEENIPRTLAAIEVVRGWTTLV